MARPRKFQETKTRHDTKKDIALREREQEYISTGNEDILKTPDFLSDYAKEEWERVVRNVKVMDNLDYSNLIAYCENFAEYKRLLETKNSSAFDAFEMMEKSALYNSMQKIGEQMRRFGDACGISRNARLKIASEKIKQEDEQIEDKFGAI